MNDISLMIHGGAGSLDFSDPRQVTHREEQRAGLTEIIRETWLQLSSGGSALDTVERAVQLLEANPVFNAGTGACLGRDQQIELDASIMEGSALGCGAVAALTGYPHPVKIARRVMESSIHVFFVGAGAEEFARVEGFERVAPEALVVEYQVEAWKKHQTKRSGANEIGSDTVGAVAMDARGNFASATSTGGMTGKAPGRVGDVPVIGAGCYADNKLGAASSSGVGETMIRICFCKSALDLIVHSSLPAQQACNVAGARLATLPRGFGGIILIDRDGQCGSWTNENHFARAMMHGGLSTPRIWFAD